MKILNRKTWGIMYPFLDKIKEKADALAKKICQTKKTSFCFLRYAKEQKPLSYLYLEYLFMALKKEKRNIKFLKEKQFIYNDLKENDCIYIAPFINNSVLLLSNNDLPQDSHLIIPVSDDIKIPSDALSDVIEEVPHDLKEELLTDKAKTIKESYQKCSKNIQKALLYIAILDKISIQMPYSVLAKLMNLTEDGLEEEILNKTPKLIYFSESEYLPHLFLNVGDTNIANMIIAESGKTKEQQLQITKKILLTLNLNDQTENAILIDCLANYFFKKQTEWLKQILSIINIKNEVLCKKQQKILTTIKTSLKQQKSEKNNFEIIKEYAKYFDIDNLADKFAPLFTNALSIPDFIPTRLTKPSLRSHSIPKEELPRPGYFATLIAEQETIFAWNKKDNNKIIICNMLGEEIYTKSTKENKCKITPDKIGLKKGALYLWRAEGRKKNYKFRILSNEEQLDLQKDFLEVIKNITHSEKAYLHQAVYAQLITDIKHPGLDLYWLSYQLLEKVKKTDLETKYKMLNRIKQHLDEQISEH